MSAPFADRFRPNTLDDVIGQRHLLGAGRALRKILESGTLPNLIFFGPSGVGKTTLAGVLAQRTERLFVRLNGTTASTADIRETIALSGTLAAPKGVLLYLDEIQYFNKKQQQTLLDCIETGTVTLVAATTENPYFYVYSALLSRCTAFEFQLVQAKELEPLVEKAFRFLGEERGAALQLEPGVCEQIARASGGDVRKALNAVELSALAAENDYVTKECARELTQKSSQRYDKDGEEHYDSVSALQKSIRGSDPDAALHYLARLLEAGDMASACRRLMVCACEDIGLAYPQIIPIVKAACDAAQMLGLPEARIPLADAVVLAAMAPKSNRAYVAYDAAAADLRAGRSGAIPRALQNQHCDGADQATPGQFYQYPHDFPGQWVAQQYLPDALVGTVYYHPGENRCEQAAQKYWAEVKREGE